MIRPFDQKQSGDIDASILTDHMMLQATELGSWNRMALLPGPMYCEEFNFPDNLEPVNILVIGYSDDDPADTNRFDAQRNSDEPVGFWRKICNEYWCSSPCKTSTGCAFYRLEICA